MMKLPKEENEQVILIQQYSRNELNKTLNEINPKYIDILQNYGFFFEKIGAVKPLMNENGEFVFSFNNWFGFIRLLEAIYDYIQ